MQEILAAVEEARRLRGTVMVEVDGKPKWWSAALAAVDGPLELRVGEPRKRRGKAWLRDRGFHHVQDAWSLPLAAGVGSSQCASTLTDALTEALEADLSRSLRRTLAFPGCADGSLPPEDAPHAEHLGAALRALALAGSGRVDVEGGRPAELWAIVWARDGELLVEPELGSEEVWTEPLSLDGAAAATRALAERIADRAGEPLFLEYLAG
jgi:hypothetical protein